MTPTQRDNESSFKPGDRVTWNEAENSLGTWASRARGMMAGAYRHNDHDNPSYAVIGLDEKLHDQTTWLVPRRILKPESIRPAPIEAVEMYGTQPSELPETLPIGTLMVAGWVSPCVLDLGAAGYYGKTTSMGFSVTAVEVDWSKVPRPPSKPAPVESWHGFRKGERVRHSLRHNGALATVLGPHRDAGAPGVTLQFDGDSNPTVALAAYLTHAHEPEAKPAVPERPSDPYAEHRRRMHTSYPQLQEHRGPELSNLEVRAAHIEYLTKQLDRPIRTGPLGTRDKYGQKVSLKGWNSDDVDELGCA